MRFIGGRGELNRPKRPQVCEGRGGRSPERAVREAINDVSDRVCCGAWKGR